MSNHENSTKLFLQNTSPEGIARHQADSYWERAADSNANKYKRHLKTEKTKNSRKLLGAGITAAAGVSLLLAANTSPSTVQIEKHTDPLQNGEQRGPNGEVIENADLNQYTDLPDDPSKLRIEVGGDQDGDGYIDDVTVHSPNDK